MMVRPDLLALTEQDLEVYSNRGTVKRAAKEVEEGILIGEWTCQADGLVIAAWSDGERCELPAGGTIREGSCSCPATGFCRHLVRTVLAYKKMGASETAAPSEAIIWNPASLSDADLETTYGAVAVKKARELFETGLLIELTLSSKPLARIHGLGMTVRFLVPGDLRYCLADCSGAVGDQAAILAVWGFRLLSPELSSGFVVSGDGKIDLPPDLLPQTETLISEVLNTGLTGLPPHFMDRLTHLEENLRQAHFVWPADTLENFSLELRRYSEHDNLFDPDRLLDHAGELLIRLQALESRQAGIPQLLIAGSRHDRQEEFGKRRFTGLGSQAFTTHKTCVLRAYLEDEESGSIVVIEKEYTINKDGLAKSFASYAELPVFPGCRFVDAASGLILTAGGKKSAGGVITPSRKAAVQPQSFDWDKLRGAFLVDDFAELDKRLDGLPPASLRSRRPGEDFYVLKVSTQQNAAFSNQLNLYQVEVLDDAGLIIHCELPYDDRASAGGELLLQHIAGNSILRFVSGTVRRSSSGLVLSLAAAVFEQAGKTIFVQPWLENKADLSGELAKNQVGQSGSPGESSAKGRALQNMREAVSGLFLSGLERADLETVGMWERAATQADQLGLSRFSKLHAEIATLVKRSAGGDKAARDQALARVRRLIVLLKLAQE